MKTNPLSSCCQAPVNLPHYLTGMYTCKKCGNPCTVKYPKTDAEKVFDQHVNMIIDNQTLRSNVPIFQSTVNASALEGLRKEFDEKIGNWLDYTHKVGYHNCPDKETAWNWFLAHASSLSDSTLREVLAEIGEDEVSKLKSTVSVNWERQRVRAIITKHLEK